MPGSRRCFVGRETTKIRSTVCNGGWFPNGRMMMRWSSFGGEKVGAPKSNCRIDFKDFVNISPPKKIKDYGSPPTFDQHMV